LPAIYFGVGLLAARLNVPISHAAVGACPFRS
jgi:hypothetical protein